MPDSAAGAGSHVLGLVLLFGALLAAVAIAFFRAKGRKMQGPHVFRASRLSRGNLLFPTQVAVTPTSVVHFTPRFVGGYEHSMHIAHVASVAHRAEPGFLERADRELRRHQSGALPWAPASVTRWR